jgi:hypothetical protein
MRSPYTAAGAAEREPKAPVVATPVNTLNSHPGDEIQRSSRQFDPMDLVTAQPRIHRCSTRRAVPFSPGSPVDALWRARGKKHNQCKGMGTGNRAI